MTRKTQIVVAILVAVIVLFFEARLRYRGTPDRKLPDQACDAELWNHVYEKDRLRVLQACAAVDGRVVSIHRNSDGDLHIALDPENKSVLSLINVMHAHGELVVEVICEHSTSAEEGQSACGGFHSQVTVPSVGDRVRVTGTYVTDRDNGWNEVHPVSRIQILP